MAAGPNPSSASATVHATGDTLDVVLGGRWQIIEPRPSWSELLGERKAARVRLRADSVEKWDSSLLLFVYEVQQWCRATGVECTLELPDKVHALVGQLATAEEAATPQDRSEPFLTTVGNLTMETWTRARSAATFIGEAAIGAMHIAQRPRKFRWRDCVEEMQQCGAMALPIVGLISFLVGLIMAYQAAVQLRQFGADIYVADLVGLAVVREMGPMMAAVVLAGRTGAAFAATLANMKANEEVDALETLGIPAVHFLVMPRILALTLMMPLLALYANGLGILGGMTIGAVVLQIPPAAYWVETQSIIDLSDLGTGLIKAFVFGILIGLAGCLRGLQAERTAMGVGRAATSAVVTSILLVIVADAIFAIVFNILGW
jgi:phospholipid/cholesterol/gamma-HCH transport system permease protein